MLKAPIRLLVTLFFCFPIATSQAGYESVFDSELDKAVTRNSLINAIEKDDYEAVAKILDSGKIDINFTTEKGGSAIIYAARKGNPGIIKALVSAGADVNHSTNAGNTTLAYAMSGTKKNAYQIAKLLIDGGLDVRAKRDPKNIEVDPPVTAAVHKGDAKLVRLFLKNGADINAKDYRLWTPLDIAIRTGKAEMARILIGHGAKIETLFISNLFDGWPPIKYAYKQGHHEAVYVAKRAKNGFMPLDIHSHFDEQRKMAEALYELSGTRKYSIEGHNFNTLTNALYEDPGVILRYEGNNTKEQLNFFNKEQLQKLRNAIFARHNYAFKTEELRAYFTELFPGYSATNKNVKLSKSDKDNVKFIRDIEATKQ
ncbi:MAG: ankyrin repeat domain-containing protein [Gammaproteobacteria bacterium]|nr:ankyrin repeat domain-containing protein [Gammaproteobacteria bacterium]